MSELFSMPPIVAAMQKEVLPNPDEVSYYVLEKERKYYLDFDIEEDTMSLHRMILRWNMEDAGIPPEQRKPIWIYIFSSGGYLSYMWALVDLIALSKTPVYTVNLGQAASAASLIYLAGHKRFMLPHAKVLIHEGSASVSGDALKVQDAAESYKKELKAMKEYILERTDIPRTQLMKKRNNDWELDAAYCLENHVCDAVINNLDEVL